jgi:transposase
MAYFLKKSKLKGRTYLSIVESFYSHDKRGTVHRTFKSLSSVESLMAQGIDDPISYFQKEVDELNRSRKENKIDEIGEISPVKFLGYFPLNSILNRLDIKKYINFYKLSTHYNFDLYDILSSLIFARCVNPCSKRRTYYEILPCLYQDYRFTYDQLLEALEFYGYEYEKIIELFTYQVNKKYGINTQETYFDCTNFYFEIDREDDFRRKGPSKENRKDPIVGMGLLLDSNQIPIGMKLYPGNESEKPILRDVIDDLKKQNHIIGKTVHVADKGLNCAQNIAYSKSNGDGYLFSKSVKQLPETEKKWVLLENDYQDVRDSQGKLLYRYKSCIDKFPYTIETNGKKHIVYLKEKRLVTYNPSLAAKKRYEINKLIEKAKSLSHSMAKKAEYGEASKYVTFKDKNGEKAQVFLNEEAIQKDLELAGYNLLVTSELKMEDRDIYQTYHNLWRIEESFRILKSDLDARPVYLQKEQTIKGHFLICYLSVLLERIFQFKILEDEYSSEQIYKFMKEFRVVKSENKYINITIKKSFICGLAEKTGLPLLHYLLTEKQIEKVLNYKF